MVDLTTEATSGSGKPSPGPPTSWPRVRLGGCPTDLLSRADALALIMDSARGDHPETLGVVSINLDHVHHFGSAQIEVGPERRRAIESLSATGVRWITLLDGAPLVKRAARLTGHLWPRLAGSDLIEPILIAAEADGLRVGFLGGVESTHRELEATVARRWPRLRLAGCWAPERADLADPERAAVLAGAVHRAGVDILVVCLGKPRQEQWIAQYGRTSGARVCLAFGAVVDFVAGRVSRAPRFVADHGLEWAWRLALEPRRLARRYLIQGPPAYLALRRASHVMESDTLIDEPASAVGAAMARPEAAAGVFAGADARADVAVIIVTYNNEADLEPLIASLRLQTADLTLRVVVADNSSTDGTVHRLRAHPDVITVETGGNLGYAGGINVARSRVGDVGAVLVLNPDLQLQLGAIAALRQRLAQPGVGVVVPRILDADGRLYTSVRREPSVVSAVGDALFGARFTSRPARFSEIEYDQRKYRDPHQVDWATGAALLIDAGLERKMHDWDERFFLYSEEIDYLRRVRESGAEVWYEPDAVLQHRRGGSGASEELAALMAVNRVRYAEKWHSRSFASALRLVVIVGSLLRVRQRNHRTSLRYLVRRGRWVDLPSAHATRAGGY